MVQGRGKVPMDSQALKEWNNLRAMDLRGTNYEDAGATMELAEELGFKALASWINLNPEAYARGLRIGFDDASDPFNARSYPSTNVLDRGGKGGA